MPQLINYQGRLTDSSGQPLDGVTVDLTFAFYGVETGGTAYLTVLQEDVVVNGGLYNVLIGSGTVTPGTEPNLGAVFQNHQDVWMGIKVDTDNEMTPRSRITSVPFAEKANTVNTSWLDAYMASSDYDGDGYTKLKDGGSDCDDNNSAVNPGASEICDDGIDNDCDGGIDGYDSECSSTCTDVDGDGYFAESGCGTAMDCDDSDQNAWDTCSTCQDNDSDTYYELCNQYVGINGPDCDDTDENNWTSCATCYDSDGDSWNAGCDDYITIDGPDCDDTIQNVWSDCSDCTDNDSDSYGVGTSCGSTVDCDDLNPDVYPAAPELCDGIDNQCPGDPFYGTVDMACMALIPLRLLRHGRC